MTEIYDDHPLLHHYTGFEGLKSILETQTLSATHYKALNDFSEVEHMCEFMCPPSAPLGQIELIG